MNKENLYKLKKLAKNLSILYIENDKKLQDEIGNFLKRLFDTYYLAYDANDVVDQCKKFNPDIILTTLDMPNKNGLDMIIDIQTQDPTVKIVILSKVNDDFELLQTIDLGITDFLIKPLNINYLLDSILVAISQLTKQSLDTRCIDDLKLIQKQNNKIESYSSYKGISIRKLAVLEEVKDDEIIMTLPYSAFMAIKYEEKTILYLKSLDKYIEVNLFNINKTKMQVTLINPYYISPNIIKAQQKRIKIDKNFKVGIHIKNNALESKVIDISFTSISIYVEDKNSILQLNDRIDLTLGVEIDGVSSMVKEKKFAKVFAQGQVLKIQPYKNGYKILSLIKVQKASQRILINYLNQRELEIIKEFKNITKVIK